MVVADATGLWINESANVVQELGLTASYANNIRVGIIDLQCILSNVNIDEDIDDEGTLNAFRASLIESILVSSKILSDDIYICGSMRVKEHFDQLSNDIIAIIMEEDGGAFLFDAEKVLKKMALCIAARFDHDAIEYLVDKWDIDKDYVKEKYGGGIGIEFFACASVTPVAALNALIECEILTINDIIQDTFVSSSPFVITSIINPDSFPMLCTMFMSDEVKELMHSLLNYCALYNHKNAQYLIDNDLITPGMLEYEHTYHEILRRPSAIVDKFVKSKYMRLDFYDYADSYGNTVFTLCMQSSPATALWMLKNNIVPAHQLILPYERQVKTARNQENIIFPLHVAFSKGDKDLAIAILNHPVMTYNNYIKIPTNMIPNMISALLKYWPGSINDILPHIQDTDIWKNEMEQPKTLYDCLVSVSKEEYDKLKTAIVYFGKQIQENIILSTDDNFNLDSLLLAKPTMKHILLNPSIIDEKILFTKIKGANILDRFQGSASIFLLPNLSYDVLSYVPPGSEVNIATNTLCYTIYAYHIAPSIDIIHKDTKAIFDSCVDVAYVINKSGLEIEYLLDKVFTLDHFVKIDDNSNGFDVSIFNKIENGKTDEIIKILTAKYNDKMLFRRSNDAPSVIAHLLVKNQDIPVMEMNNADIKFIIDSLNLDNLPEDWILEGLKKMSDEEINILPDEFDVCVVNYLRIYEHIRSRSMITKKFLNRVLLDGRSLFQCTYNHCVLLRMAEDNMITPDMLTYKDPTGATYLDMLIISTSVDDYALALIDTLIDIIDIPDVLTDAFYEEIPNVASNNSVIASLMRIKHFSVVKFLDKIYNKIPSGYTNGEIHNIIVRVIEEDDTLITDNKITISYNGLDRSVLDMMLLENKIADEKYVPYLVNTDILRDNVNELIKNNHTLVGYINKTDNAEANKVMVKAVTEMDRNDMNVDSIMWVMDSKYCDKDAYDTIYRKLEGDLRSDYMLRIIGHESLTDDEKDDILIRDNDSILFITYAASVKEDVTESGIIPQRYMEKEIHMYDGNRYNMATAMLCISDCAIYDSLIKGYGKKFIIESICKYSKFTMMSLYHNDKLLTVTKSKYFDKECLLHCDISDHSILQIISDMATIKYIVDNFWSDDLAYHGDIDGDCLLMFATTNFIEYLIEDNKITKKLISQVNNVGISSLHFYLKRIKSGHDVDKYCKNFELLYNTGLIDKDMLLQTNTNTGNNILFDICEVYDKKPMIYDMMEQFFTPDLMLSVGKKTGMILFDVLPIKKKCDMLDKVSNEVIGYKDHVKRNILMRDILINNDDSFIKKFIGSKHMKRSYLATRDMKFDTALIHAGRQGAKSFTALLNHDKTQPVDISYLHGDEPSVLDHMVEHSPDMVIDVLSRNDANDIVKRIFIGSFMSAVCRNSPKVFGYVMDNHSYMLPYILNAMTLQYAGEESALELACRYQPEIIKMIFNHNKYANIIMAQRPTIQFHALSTNLRSLIYMYKSPYCDDGFINCQNDTGMKVWGMLHHHVVDGEHIKGENIREKIDKIPLIYSPCYPAPNNEVPSICIICFDNHSNVMLDCGGNHIFCSICAIKLNECPTCRRCIKKRVLMY